MNIAHINTHHDFMLIKSLFEIVICSDEVSSDSEAGQEKENLTQPYKRYDVPH